MNTETRRCKHCGKTLIQATYWYCPEEVVYTPNMAASVYTPYIHRADTTGPTQDTFDKSMMTFFPNANASASSVPTLVCVHEPVEPVEPDANTTLCEFCQSSDAVEAHDMGEGRTMRLCASCRQHIADGRQVDAYKG